MTPLSHGLGATTLPKLTVIKEANIEGGRKSGRKRRGYGDREWKRGGIERERERTRERERIEREGKERDRRSNHGVDEHVRERERIEKEREREIDR